jgi:hypothetical protein
MAVQAACRGGSFAVESVAAFAWNGWQASSGISGNLGLEYAPASNVNGHASGAQSDRNTPANASACAGNHRDAVEFFAHAQIL